jgi:hypothetical protein
MKIFCSDFQGKLSNEVGLISFPYEEDTHVFSDITFYRYFECGPWAGKLFCLVVVLDFIIWKILEWLKVSTSFLLEVIF